MKSRMVVLVGLIVFIAAAGIPVFGQSGREADYPNKPIEFVSQTAGASMDILVRVLINVIQENKILPQPIAVNNKGGAGGANQMVYVLGKKANPYVFFGTSTNLLLGTPMLEKLPYSHADFTPIAVLSYDGSVVYVRADSPFKTIQDLVAEARKRPKGLTMATSSVSSGESMTGRALQKNLGIEWNIVYFSGDAEVTTNVLGGNIDFAIGNPNSVIEHIRAGKIRALMANAPKRYANSYLKDVPTIVELGFGEAYVARRALLGPANMPEYAVKKLEDAFYKATQSPQWAKFLEDNLQTSEWMGSEAFGKWLDAEAPKHRQRLLDAGLLK